MLKDPRWQKKRLEIFNRDNFTCKLCGDPKSTLHIHHKKYASNTSPWDYQNDSLVTLCEHCHDTVEKVKKSHPEIDIDLMSVFKAFTTDSCVLMFVAHPGHSFVSIFNEDGSKIKAYVIDKESTLDIIKVLKNVGEREQILASNEQRKLD